MSTNSLGRQFGGFVSQDLPYHDISVGRGIKLRKFVNGHRQDMYVANGQEHPTLDAAAASLGLRPK